MLFHAALGKSENFIKLINANFVKAHKASKWEREKKRERQEASIRCWSAACQHMGVNDRHMSGRGNTESCYKNGVRQSDKRERKRRRELVEMVIKWQQKT